jgi:hypothetical protein
VGGSYVLEVPRFSINVVEQGATESRNPPSNDYTPVWGHRCYGVYDEISGELSWQTSVRAPSAEDALRARLEPIVAVTDVSGSNPIKRIVVSRMRLLRLDPELLLKGEALGQALAEGRELLLESQEQRRLRAVEHRRKLHERQQEIAAQAVRTGWTAPELSELEAVPPGPRSRSSELAEAGAPTLDADDSPQLS